jgi:hypothetical protein
LSVQPPISHQLVIQYSHFERGGYGSIVVMVVPN